MGNAGMCVGSSAEEQGEIIVEGSPRKMTNFVQASRAAESREPSEIVAIKISNTNIASLLSEEVRKKLVQMNKNNSNNAFFSQQKMDTKSFNAVFRYKRSGEVYSGNFNTEGQREGFGRLLSADGEYFEGEFVRDIVEGRGRLIKDTLVTYEGGFKNGQFNGHGVESWPDGSCYEGEFTEGRKNGKGHFSWNDGSVYEGEFFWDKFHGQGAYKWADGRIYTGGFKDNLMDGSGEFRWPNGQTYVGNYKEDKKHGRGEMRFPQKSLFRGEFFEGKKHGEGIYVDAQGKEKKGVWQSDKLIKWSE